MAPQRRIEYSFDDETGDESISISGQASGSSRRSNQVPSGHARIFWNSEFKDILVEDDGMTLAEAYAEYGVDIGYTTGQVVTFASGAQTLPENTPLVAGQTYTAQTARETKGN